MALDFAEDFFIEIFEMKQTEYFSIVDEEGNSIGRASRMECHSGSFLLHPVVHMHILNSKKELYLQKRSLDKDIQPGKWDTSVGGHVDYGESVQNALFREVQEELGFSDFSPIFLMRYKFVSPQEAELVHSYYAIYDGIIIPDEEEISEGRFWNIDDVLNNIGKGIFTPNFEMEFQRIISEKLLPIKCA